MYKKENIQPNFATAPTLFLGLGGFGSEVVQGIHERCERDNRSNFRFVIMDTNVNDLREIERESPDIVTIQTSSTGIVEAYLERDTEAKTEWFPVNSMLDHKTVSEGAGQVRAVSRLALNDILTNGRIAPLYTAIDELFLKNGEQYSQAVRVVISGTIVGGTGSGIAMEMGMLVRHYIQKNYPEAAVMISGLLALPGVMYTVIKQQSEQDRLRYNGYAAVKEINAFMMKDGGFFDTVPELNRYKGLSMTIPSANGKQEKISNLPFDFCFLMDRTDKVVKNMATKKQYIDYAARALYEQYIGPVKGKISGMEDNVLAGMVNKPEKLGRSRFGALGASALIYPYEDIRNYIALTKARAAIIGSSDNSVDQNVATEKLTDKEAEEARKKLLESSWLQYDKAFDEELRKFRQNPNASSKDEPKRAATYIAKIDAGSDPTTANGFSQTIYDKYIRPKVATLRTNQDTGGVIAQYIKDLKEGAKKAIERAYHFEADDVYTDASGERDGYESRYNAINKVEDAAKREKFKETVRSFAKEVFSSQSSAEKESGGSYLLEKFLSVGNGKMMHPNAVRYFLYKFMQMMDPEDRTSEYNKAQRTIQGFDEIKKGIVQGVTEETDAGGNKETSTDISQFQVGRGPIERNLREMCIQCDKKTGANSSKDKCTELLASYWGAVDDFFQATILDCIWSVAKSKIERLSQSYENFFVTLESKVPGIEKRKAGIVSKLKFSPGDCEIYLMGDQSCLDKLVDKVKLPSDSGENMSQLYSDIFVALRENAYIEERGGSSIFETKKDVFDEVVIKAYQDELDKLDGSAIQVENILEAIQLECDIKDELIIDQTADDCKDEKLAHQKNTRDARVRNYINDKIARSRILASPNISRADNAEPNEVNAVACNDGLKDTNGITVSDYLDGAVESPSVSKYELRFFSAVYNLEPNQLSKFRAPVYSDLADEFELDEDSLPKSGDYFATYQKFMNRIGPDSKANSVITPHVDIHWNAISAMPELDLECQRRLMRKIHKAMLYGFIYKRIEMHRVLENCPDYLAYKYLDRENNLRDMAVSNKTKCDVLYEVLDALYYDRAAVETIREYVGKQREIGRNRGCYKMEDLEFFQELKKLTFAQFTNDPEMRKIADQASIFTIVLMYGNTLPAANKDMSEIKRMVEAVIEVMYGEMMLCTTDMDAVHGSVANLLVEQYDLLMKNFTTYHSKLYGGLFSEQMIDMIRKTLCGFFDNNTNSLRNHQTELQEFSKKLAKWQNVDLSVDSKKTDSESKAKK